MAFLASFIQTAVKLVLMAAVAGCGLFFGKKLRDRKDEKTAAETLVQNEKYTVEEISCEEIWSK